jgi:4-hydroxy-tetrahydrodipicolinate synthase
MTGRWGGVLTAMVTPFDSEGRLDLDVAAELARYLAANGNDGLVVAGTTGESPTLSDAEKLDLCRAVTEAVTIPVVLGTGSNDTAHSVELTRQATGVGAAGVLVVTPYYSRPSQRGIEAHFRACAAATDLPAMLYDIPVRTGRKIDHDVLVRLSYDVPNIVACKDAAQSPAASARLAAETAPGFELYSGDDVLNLAFLSIGAVGFVSVAAHWCGVECQELLATFEKGEVVRAREVNVSLLDSWAFVSDEAAPNPVPAKAMMRVLGLPVGDCRLPMGPTPAGLEDQARAVLAALRGAADS